MEFIKDIFKKLSEIDYHSIMVNPLSNCYLIVKKKVTYQVKSVLFDCFVWGVRTYFNIYFSVCKKITHIKKYNFVETICNFFKKTPKNPTFTLNVLTLYFIDKEYHFENLHKEIIYYDLTQNKKQKLLTQYYINTHSNKNYSKEIIDSIISINDNYIHVCQDSKVTSNYIEKNSETKFIYIIYINNVTNETVELSLDKDMYKVGNQLFSPVFVYKSLRDLHQESKFNMDYMIEIIDNKVVILKMNKNKMIEITENGYEIKDI